MKKLWEKWSHEGLRWPYLHDPVNKKPSITLLFPYITFVIAAISLLLLHIWPSMLVATAMSIFMWALATVFYMLRKLTKAKFDLENKSFELDNGDSETEPTQPSPDDLTSN
jgi:cbb3-type cytochrome oxidase subunit 3